MTSLIVLAADKTKRDEYIKDFCSKQNIDVFDQTSLTLETSVKQNTQSIGIEDIKQMQKKIFLKPLKSKQKAIIIDEAELLTIEAQNALLKILEEPPANTFIILSGTSKETLLPTILSRCHIIQLEEEMSALSEKEKLELQLFLDELPKLGIGERLKKAETLAKDKEKTIEWVMKLILVLRETLLKEYSSETHLPRDLSLEASAQWEVLAKWGDTLRKFQSLHTTLKTTNVNPRFAIENTLLSIAS